MYTYVLASSSGATIFFNGTQEKGGACRKLFQIVRRGGTVYYRDDGVVLYNESVNTRRMRIEKTCTYYCVVLVDGTKQCSMCVEKAAKQKLEEVSKPSPIHSKLQLNKGALFLHPLPSTKGQQDR